MDFFKVFFTTITAILLAGFIVFAAAVICAYPVMWAWNYGLVPAIPSINKIDFWEAIWIFLLAKLLLTASVTNNMQNNNKK